MRLDTKFSRDIISKNKFLNIKAVPTLLVVYDEGNIQLFEGKKVEIWLQSFLDNMTQLALQDDENDDFNETVIDDNDTEFIEQDNGMKFMSAKDTDSSNTEYLSSLKKGNGSESAVSMAARMETERNNLDEKQKAMWTPR